MNTCSPFSSRALSLFLMLALATGASLAEKPDHVGPGKGKKAKHSQQVANDVVVGKFFVERQRAEVISYYGRAQKAGHCPPGLAKKNNGCMPLGQARKWQIGQPMPTTVVLYPVPQSVVVRIGPAPAGHRYVRVANDLLLIAIGSQLVVDAIEDLMRL